MRGTMVATTTTITTQQNAATQPAAARWLHTEGFPPARHDHGPLLVRKFQGIRDNDDERDSFVAYLKDISGVDLLSHQQEQALALRVQAGDQDARRQFIEANTRLVISIARKYVGHGIDLIDLIQEGNIGLITAVDKFDLTKGKRFSSYATWWIFQAVNRAVEERNGAIHIPSWASAELRRIRHAQRRCLQTLGREARIEEIAGETGIDATRVQDLLRAMSTPASLDAASHGAEEDLTLGGLLEDEEAESVEDVVVKEVGEAELMQRLRQVLSPREYEIVRLRYGLTTGSQREHTLEEIGRMWGISRERVRQLEAGALAKLRLGASFLFPHCFFSEEGGSQL